LVSLLLHFVVVWLFKHSGNKSVNKMGVDVGDKRL